VPARVARLWSGRPAAATLAAEQVQVNGILSPSRDGRLLGESPEGDVGGQVEMVNFIVWIIVGGIAGFLAGKVITGKGMGLLWDIVVGILGGFLGGWLAGLVGIAAGNILIEIVVAFVGAAILLVVFRALTGRGMIHA
jgi:uncharacterized membrane protein YeaQ/YmgE (transglycosylase-associated protein family)